MWRSLSFNGRSRSWLLNRSRCLLALFTIRELFGIFWCFGFWWLLNLRLGNLCLLNWFLFDWFWYFSFTCLRVLEGNRFHWQNRCRLLNRSWLLHLLDRSYRLLSNRHCSLLFLRILEADSALIYFELSSWLRSRLCSCGWLLDWFGSDWNIISLFGVLETRIACGCWSYYLFLSCRDRSLYSFYVGGIDGLSQIRELFGIHVKDAGFIVGKVPEVSFLGWGFGLRDQLTQIRLLVSLLIKLVPSAVS